MNKIIFLALPTLFAVMPPSILAETVEGDSVGTRLGEAIVTGTREKTSARNVPVTVSVVGRETLEEYHRENVLPTLMEQVPGLMVTGRGVMGYGVSSGGSGGMMLRGLSSSNGQIMVLIDGHPQYSGIYGHTVADSYQTIMADHVEVLRGPASMLYGSNAMGGVINIITRQADSEGVHTQASIGGGSYGTFKGEVGSQIRRGRFSGIVAAQYGRSDNHRPNMGVYEYGGFANVNYGLSENWTIFASTNIMHDGSSWPGTIQTPMREADQWITRGAVNAGVENHFSKTNGRFSVYDNFGRHKINDGYEANGGTPQSRLFRSRDALIGVSWYQTAGFWRNGNLTVGMDYQHIYGRAFYTDRQSGRVIDTPNKQSGHVHNNEWAGYINLQQILSSWLTFDAGIRYDHHSVTGGEWVPEGGIVVRPTKNGEAKLMVSKGFRNPTMRELYLYPPSNENLRPERMMNYEISWRHRPWKGRLNYGVNIFYVNADNLIQTVNRKNINTGRLENYGIEADASCNFSSHWMLTTNHSFLHMKHPVVSAPVYKGHISAKYSNGKWGLKVGLTQIAGLYTSVGSGEHQENVSLLSVSVDYRFNKYLKVWTTGENLLGEHYEFVAGNPMPKAIFMGGVTLSL